MATASKAFQEYALFSVRVDQYYAATNIFAFHYDALKNTYLKIPKDQAWPKDMSCLSPEAAQFLVLAANALNYMGTTNVFSEAPFQDLQDLPRDMGNFGFYTCYCFQWTLFENFVKDSIAAIINEGLLQPPIVKKVKNLMYKTEQFLKCIDSGLIFGNSPFFTILPITGWVPTQQECRYADLDLIRKQRNSFIHAIRDTSILPIEEGAKQRLYDRSMWILRLFAGNIDQDVQKMRNQP